MNEESRKKKKIKQEEKSHKKLASIGKKKMKTANKNLQFICLRKVGCVYYIWTNELEDCLEKTRKSQTKQIKISRKLLAFLYVKWNVPHRVVETVFMA